MSLLQSRYTWNTWASTVGTPVNFSGYGLENTFYIEAGAASSGVVNIQTARTADGPWATIASTTVGTTGTVTVLEVTGPYLWIRPTVPTSGGTWIIEAVSFG